MTIPLKVLLLKVCAQLRPTAVNMAPSAFAAERRAAAPCCSPVLLQSGCLCDRQTDRRTDTVLLHTALLRMLCEHCK